jgi:putative transposase
MSKAFDFEAAVKALRDAQGLSGTDGILTPLIKQFTEAALNAAIYYFPHSLE